MKYKWLEKSLVGIITGLMVLIFSSVCVSAVTFVELPTGSMVPDASCDNSCCYFGISSLEVLNE